MKTLVINLYFGKRPDYFDLFLISCAKNPKIDFLFFVDFDVPFDIPENVKFVNRTFKEVVKLFQLNFDFNIALNFPYKLTDFQPAIGEVLQAHLKDYHWWGHCDFDMVFGDLSAIVKLAEESNYVKILRQGHLTLYKNDAEINKVYRNDFAKLDLLISQNGENIHMAYPNDGVYMRYKDVLTTDKIYAFDEFWGVDRLFYMSNLPVYREPVMADISYKSTFVKMTAHKNYVGQYFIWEGGKVSRKSLFNRSVNLDSYPYIHLQKRKMKQHYAVVSVKSKVVINQFGIFDSTKWSSNHFLFAIMSCIPNLGHWYRYYFPRLIKRLKP